VLSVHELHIWQLSETKIIASVHINVSREVDFMLVASDIRNILVQHGIHSSTIQPEYRDTVPEERSKVRHPEKHEVCSTDSQPSQDMNCLISCPPDSACCADHACCRELEENICCAHRMLIPFYQLHTQQPPQHKPQNHSKIQDTVALWWILSVSDSHQ
jgi:zinc transporter 1